MRSSSSKACAPRKRDNYPAVFKIASKSARLKGQVFELRWGPRKAIYLRHRQGCRNFTRSKEVGTGGGARSCTQTVSVTP